MSLFKHMLLTAATLLLLACTTGCPVEQSSSPPAKVCKVAGKRCVLSGNQLGVCTARPGQMDTLVCQSQH